MRLAALVLVGGAILAGSTVAGILGPGENRFAEAKADKSPYVSGSLYITQRRPALPDMPPPDTKEEHESFLAVQSELVKSRLVLNSALQNKTVADLPILKSQADPLAWLGKNLRVEYQSREVLLVGLDGDDTAQLMIVVDAVVEAYLHDIVNRERTTATSRLQVLRNMEQDTSRSLLRSRETLRTLSKPDPQSDFKQRLVQDQYKSAIKDLIASQSDLRRLLVEEEVLKSGGGDRATRLAAVRERIEIQKKLEKVLSGLAEDLAQRIKNPKQGDLEPLRSEIKLNEELLLRIRRAIQEASLSLDMPPRVVLLEKATARTRK